MIRTIAKHVAFTTSAGLALAIAAPASAAEVAPHGVEIQHGYSTQVLGDMSFQHKRKYKRKHYRKHHRHYRDSYYGRDARYYRSYGEPVYRDTRIWRGRDGRYYCRRRDGDTGLLIGAGVGALAGHELAGRGGDRTLGAILGAAGGAILGRSIDRSNSRCR
ncbi:glycine zipper 2TM domain-containing protein [Altererythrobacter sp.]|uniref:glycine zipper 2TM domain-containing protein n=1 Tax=Altererythrobacter sp. TaxID=1872480 RepID=UPI003D06D60F